MGTPFDHGEWESLQLIAIAIEEIMHFHASPTMTMLLFFGIQGEPATPMMVGYLPLLE